MWASFDSVYIREAGYWFLLGASRGVVRGVFTCNRFRHQGGLLFAGFTGRGPTRLVLTDPSSRLFIISPGAEAYRNDNRSWPDESSLTISSAFHHVQCSPLEHVSVRNQREKLYISAGGFRTPFTDTPSSKPLYLAPSPASPDRTRCPSQTKLSPWQVLDGCFSHPRCSGIL